MGGFLPSEAIFPRINRDENRLAGQLHAVISFASAVLACAPSLAADEKYEFLTGETLCVDSDRIVEQKNTVVFGGGKKLASLSVRLDETVLKMEPDKLLNREYFLDLATFIENNPNSVSADASGAFYRLDVVMRPPAEVDSMRLRDRLAAGDGSMSIVASKSIQDLRGASLQSDDHLADIFLATCWSDERGKPRCERRFPFLGFRVSYSVPPEWETVAAKDQEVRSHLAKVVNTCG